MLDLLLDYLPIISILLIALASILDVITRKNENKKLINAMYICVVVICIIQVTVFFTNKREERKERGMLNDKLDLMTFKYDSIKGDEIDIKNQLWGFKVSLRPRASCQPD